MPALIPAREVQKHNTAEDLWVVVEGSVYDLSSFAPEHPEGLDILLQHAGRDATAAYSAVHSEGLIKSSLPASKQLGPVDPASIPRAWSQPEATTVTTTAATTSALAPASAPTPAVRSKPPLETLISAHDFAAAAEASLPPKSVAFITSAATDLHTHRRNASAYASIGLRPRVLRNVASVSLRTTILGRAVRSPIFCAPTSLGKMVRPEGERDLGRACRGLGVAQVVSSAASFSLPEIVAAADAVLPASDPSAPPLFLQLYVNKERHKSEVLLRQAAALGVRGVFVTVDAPLPGKREADERVAADPGIRSGMSGAVARNDARGGGLGRVMGAHIDASLTWDDIAWVRSCLPAGTPVVLKGVQTAMDARMALDAGVEGIVVSNHGGRSLDTAPAAVLVLLELHRNCPEVFDRMDVFVDGGITRGTDIFKALCLGAKAVGVGRGFLYGLNYGVEGIRRYVDSELNPSCFPCLCSDTSDTRGHRNHVLLANHAPSRSSQRRARDHHEDVRRHEPQSSPCRVSEHAGRRPSYPNDRRSSLRKVAAEQEQAVGRDLSLSLLKRQSSSSIASYIKGGIGTSGSSSSSRYSRGNRCTNCMQYVVGVP